MSGLRSLPNSTELRSSDDLVAVVLRHSSNSCGITGRCFRILSVHCIYVRKYVYVTVPGAGLGFFFLSISHSLCRNTISIQLAK